MRNPFNIKEVQQLTWRLVSLAYFLSCAGDSAFDFFATLKKTEKFKWTSDCGEVSSNLKAFQASPSILTCSITDSPLYIYVYINEQAMIYMHVQET